MITRTFKIKLATETEEEMQKESDYLAMIYGAEEDKIKTGRWLKIDTEAGVLGITYNMLKCSRCGWSNSLIIPRHYCPRCGAKMEV